MIHIFIDLSPDEIKYKTRYIGLRWQYSLAWGVLDKVRTIFGYDLPSMIILRRKTKDELVNYCLALIKQKNENINVDDHNLKLRLAHYISKGESDTFEWEGVKYHLTMKW